MMSRFTLRRDIEYIYKTCRPAVFERIRTNGGKISIQLDGGKSELQRLALLGICLTWIETTPIQTNKNWSRKTIVLNCADIPEVRMTGENIAQACYQAIHDAKLAERIMAFVADNEAKNSSCYKYLTELLESDGISLPEGGWSVA